MVRPSKPELEFFTESGKKITVGATSGVKIWENQTDEETVGYEPAHHWYEFAYPALMVPPFPPDRMAIIGVGCNIIGKLTQKIHANEISPGKWEARPMKCDLVDIDPFPHLESDETFTLHKMDGIDFLSQFPEDYFDYVALDPYPVGQLAIDKRFITKDFSKVMKCAKRWSIALLKSENHNDSWSSAENFLSDWRMQNFKQFRAHFVPFFSRRRS